MLSLAELRRLTPILTHEFSGHVVERWVQPDGQCLALALYGGRSRSERGGSKRFVLFSCRPGLARVGELDALPKAPDNPPAFVSFLRAHLSRARVLEARLIGEDRVVALRLSAREGEFDLVLSILGAKSNLYVVDADGVIRATLRAPSETRSELTVGARFQPPLHGRPQFGEDRFEASPDAALLRTIEAVYADQEEDRAHSDLAKSLRQTLRREAKNAKRRLEKLEAELEEAEQANALQRQGELLKTALGRVELGATSIEVDDYETGERVRISLDPAKTPKENLKALFKRYQKFVRRLTKAGGQVDAARSSCEALAGLMAELDAAAPESGPLNPDGLAALAEHPDVAR
ncbi:NFACT family protein, partial [Myxococcota bacterium]|nr:NFACT family protein [Myxococcota bacterium]